MKRLVWLAMTLPLAAIGCGDQSKECGPGTADLDGTCTAVCGTGTIYAPDGTCVPDGSVICTDGTVYELETGTCVIDPGACQGGTVLIGDECLDPAEGFDVDASEGAEPNGLGADDDLAGVIDVPDVGGDPFVVYGCITPFEDLDGDDLLDADYDTWALTVTGPTALRITADGVGGLAAGYWMLPTDDELFDGGWERYGVNLTNDTSQRELFLPKAGVYLLALTDSRALFLDAAGSADTCYYASIEQIALPAATPAIVPTDADDHDGALQVRSLPSVTEGEIFQVQMGDPTTAMISAFTFMADGQFVASPTETSSFFGDEPAFLLRGGWSVGDDLSVVIDPVYNYALTPVPYTLATDRIQSQALPADGDLTHTSKVDQADLDTFDDVDFAYFDIAEDDTVAFFDLSMGGFGETSLVIFDAQFTAIALVADFDESTDAFDGHVRFPTAGRYYVATYLRDAEEGDTYTLASVFEQAAVAPLTVGTSFDDEPIGPGGASFFRLDLNDAIWIAESGTSGSTFFGPSGIRRTILPDVPSGLVEDFDVLEQRPFSGGAPFPIITYDVQDFYLVRIESTTSSFDYTVTNRDFTDLDTVMEGMDASRANFAIQANGEERFFVRANPGDQVTIDVTDNTGDLSITQLVVFEFPVGDADAGGAGGSETYVTQVGEEGFVAFVVSSATGAAGTFDLLVTAVPPPGYNVAAGALTYTDICAGGANVVPQEPWGLDATLGDEARTDEITLPFGFELHADGVSTMRVNTNGFVSFDGMNDPGAPYFSNQAVGLNDDVNGFIAPLWEDLDEVQICYQDDGTSVTVQWTGVQFQTTTAVQMQLVIHDDWSLDFVYGPGHQMDGSSGTVGTERLDASTGEGIGFNTPGTTPANSSKILTPDWTI